VNRALVVVTRVGWAWSVVVPSEEWIAARETLLDRVTTAALKRVEVPFSWVWLVCPERYEQVREIADRLYPQAILVAQDSDSEAIAPNDSAFVVALVDSDDAYHHRALEEVSMMDLGPDTLVNWPNGWQLDWRRGWLSERGWTLRNQGGFLAITSEGRENVSTMLLTGGNHTKARKGRHVVTVDSRSWVRVNHNLNVSSTHWPDRPMLSDEKRASVLSEVGIVWRPA